MFAKASTLVFGGGNFVLRGLGALRSFGTQDALSPLCAKFDDDVFASLEHLWGRQCAAKQRAGAGALL